MIFLSKHNILTPYQCGDHLLRWLFFEEAFQSLSQGLLTWSLLWPEPAFDVVDHTILLHKLSKYGISVKAYSWFSSYITNRILFVEINKDQNINHTENLQVLTEVFQGCALTLPLFLIFINDSTNNPHIILFADDTSFLFNADDHKSME